MNYTKEIFQRATIRGLAEYLLYGAPATEDNKAYEVRISDAFHQFDEQAKKCTKEKESELSDFVNLLVSETSDVYTEVGLQAGFLIMIDMIKNIGFSVEVKTEESQKSDYAEMYKSLFQNVSIALQLLQEHNEESVEKAKILLKSAQCATEEIYIMSKPE